MRTTPERFADVAELADALASGASELTLVEVRILSSAIANERTAWVAWPSVFSCANSAETYFGRQHGDGIMCAITGSVAVGQEFRGERGRIRLVSVNVTRNRFRLLISAPRPDSLHSLPA